MLALLALVTAAVFLLLHPYRGLVHDGRLYTIQALSHLYPDLYGNDVFVRFGSQDDYTLFSPIYAAMISWLGVEPSAAALTFGAICLFLAAAWMLARELLPQRQATVALLLLILIPAHYGPARIFYYLEEFITPRQLSEALVLFCLVAWLKHRRPVAVLLAAAAMLIHPIIGLSGATLLITLQWVLPHWRKLWPLLLVAILIAALAASGWLRISQWQFDAQWYRIVMMRDYLGLSNWVTEDWGRIATVFSTLAVAGISLDGRLRRIAVAALLTTGLLLLLTLIGGDLLRIAIVVQAQPWRALWLATVLAILLLPQIYVAGWHTTHLSRCTLLLLAAAWATSHPTLPLIIAPLAVIAMSFARRPLPPQYGRLLEGGSWIALAMAIIYSVATAQLTWEEGLTQLETLPPQLDRLLTLSHNSVIPALVLFAGGYVALRFRSRITMAALTVAAVAAIATLAVPVAKTWAATLYDDALKESFNPWRALIPPGSEVLWVSAEPEIAAPSTWLLLERPSFISITQAPNALFSRAAAIEMSKRAEALTGLLPFWDPFRPRQQRPATQQGKLLLEPVCRNLNVRYVVTNETLVDVAPITAPVGAPLFLRDSKLYICP